MGIGSCCLVLDARRKVGCFAEIFEMISQVPSSTSHNIFYFQRPVVRGWATKCLRDISLLLLMASFCKR